jgi:hypothetical protein
LPGFVAKSKKSCQEIKIALKDFFAEINVIEKQRRRLGFYFYADRMETALWACLYPSEISADMSWLKIC